MEAGARIAQFEVIEPLGRGGLAEVYLVRRPQLQSLHAIKLLHVEGPQWAARLHTEGRIQAGLRHPNILPVTDVVEHDGKLGLVMEYVDGTSLDRLLEEKKQLELDLAASLFRQMLEAIGAAHHAGVLHRDLKPSNVLLVPLREGYHVKVADFGIAKEGQEANLTRTGTMMGTPGYMSPEQQEDAAHVDARTDVFALGVILYEMLGGRPPFHRAQLHETLSAVAKGDCDALDRLRPGLPAELCRAVHRAIRPNPHQRYADCAEMRDAFRTAFELPRRTTSESPPPTPAAANPTLVAAANPTLAPANTRAVERPTLAPSNTRAVERPAAEQVPQGFASRRDTPVPPEPPQAKEYKRFLEQDHGRPMLGRSSARTREKAPLIPPPVMLFLVVVVPGTALGVTAYQAQQTRHAIVADYETINRARTQLADNEAKLRQLGADAVALGADPTEIEAASAALRTSDPVQGSKALLDAITRALGKMGKDGDANARTALMQRIADAREPIAAIDKARRDYDLQSASFFGRTLRRVGWNDAVLTAPPAVTAAETPTPAETPGSQPAPTRPGQK